MRAASFKLFVVRTVTKAIPAAKTPKASAITTERVINKTIAVETEAEIAIRRECFTGATIAKAAHRSL